jgi:5'-3' exonuclease
MDCNGYPGHNGLFHFAN